MPVYWIAQRCFRAGHTGTPEIGPAVYRGSGAAPLPPVWVILNSRLEHTRRAVGWETRGEAIHMHRLTRRQLIAGAAGLAAGRAFGANAPAAPVAPPHAAAVAVPEEDNHNIRNGWAAWAGVSVMVNVIWLATWLTGDGGCEQSWRYRKSCGAGDCGVKEFTAFHDRFHRS